MKRSEMIKIIQHQLRFHQIPYDECYFLLGVIEKAGMLPPHNGNAGDLKNPYLNRKWEPEEDQPETSSKGVF